VEQQQRFSPEDEEKLSMLEAMGFPREMAVAALRAAFGDADRAVQYLMDGIPDDLMTDRDPPAPAAPAAQPAAARAPPAAAPPAGGAAPFSADSVAMALGALGGAPRAAMTPLQRMQSDPQFMQLIAMARQNPALVQPLLTQLAASNPPMLQLIQQHQADFTSLLNGTAPPLAAPPPAAQGGPFTGADILAAMGMGTGGAPAGGAPAPNTVPPAGPPGMVRIALTPAEAEAVARLESMGFPRDVVLQSYMACDKDENAAANLLFDGGM
jgi:UV excision repair protein Rad23